MGNLYDHGVVMRLVKYALPYRSWVVAAFIGMAGHIITMVLQPLIIGWAINQFVDVVTGQEATGGSLEDRRPLGVASSLPLSSLSSTCC